MPFNAINDETPALHLMTITLAGYKLITTFGREHESRQRDETSRESCDAPRNRAKDPGFVQLPALEKSIVVIKQVCL